MRKNNLLRGEQTGRRDWWEAAACRTADPDLFFPVSSVGPGRDEVARAKEVCAGCRVLRQCLQFALATRQAHGVWGGTTEEERRLRVPSQHDGAGRLGRGWLRGPRRQAQPLPGRRPGRLSRAAGPGTGRSPARPWP